MKPSGISSRTAISSAHTSATQTRTGDGADLTGGMAALLGAPVQSVTLGGEGGVAAVHQIHSIFD